MSSIFLLFQEILKSESEYVRTELMSLQQQLRQLEDLAASIEKDIKEAIAKGKQSFLSFSSFSSSSSSSFSPSYLPNCQSVGDSAMEERLTQGNFKLLNRRNQIVKRQIELNLLYVQRLCNNCQYLFNYTTISLSLPLSIQRKTGRFRKAAILHRVRASTSSPNPW